MASYDIAIIGGGPGGLSCAKEAAVAGYSVILFERKPVLGPKVCAGGITWNGLMKYFPGYQTEQDFSTQYLKTTFQDCSIRADHPIVSTVDRLKLGRFMQTEAETYGAKIFSHHVVRSIDEHQLTVVDKDTKEHKKINYKYLVGADGSSSLVRRYLGVPVSHLGAGVNYQIDESLHKMEWHIKPNLFKNGYGWIFPHKNSVSIGAYCPVNTMSSLKLKEYCIKWAKDYGFDLSEIKCQAELINYDYRGVRFGNNNNVFLVGDAAGLASGLTGEGIYPAIVSGKGVVEMIKNGKDTFTELDTIVKNHKQHSKILEYAGYGNISAIFLSELMALGYRTKILKFENAEMA